MIDGVEATRAVNRQNLNVSSAAEIEIRAEL